MNNSTGFLDRLIAHRGCQQLFPENSHAGIAHALSLGIKYIEIDINLSADGVFVLCHDSELQRLTGEPLLLKNCSLKHLQTLSFHEPERLGEQFYPTPICSLTDCLALISSVANSHVYIEIKRESLLRVGREPLLEQLYPVIKDYLGQLSLISFDMEVLTLAHKQQRFPRLLPIIHNIEQWHSRELAHLNPPLVISRLDRLPNRPSELPYPVALYEIENFAQAQHWLEQGATQLESFATAQLLADYRASR